MQQTKELQAYIEPLKEALSHQYEISTKGFKQGSTAYVLFAVQKSLSLKRVIKILRRELADQSDFLREEILKLSELTHQNIIKILDANEIKTNRKKIPFYIMEYLDGADELDKYLRKHSDKLTRDKLIAVFKSILEGIAFMHSKQIYHMDIKEKNILVSNNEEVKIADVGFAKKKSTNRGSTKLITTYRSAHPELQKKIVEEDPKNPEKYARVERSVIQWPWKNIGPKYDIYSTGFVFNELLKMPNVTNILSSSDVIYLTLLAEQMMQDHYGSVLEVIADLTKLDTATTAILSELSDYPKNIIRIPELVSVSFTARLRKLVRHPYFLRLQKMKQLSLCHFVYPGATHSRFEHSLGVYSNACKYSNALLFNVEKFRLIMNKEDILSLLMAALCHDLGQYPFAHAFEDIDAKYSHEVLTIRLLKGDLPIDDMKEYKRQFDDILSEWGISSDSIVSLLDHSTPDSKTRQMKKKILKAIIDGPVDADKLDYLSRDSIHTGVLYGRFLDKDRFLQSLAIDHHNSLALTHKGRISAELFTACRYAMFSEVYWHRTVRSLHAMIAYAVEKYVERIDFENFLKLVFSSSDEYILEGLLHSGIPEVKEIVEKIKNRIIYKEIAMFRNDNNDPDSQAVYMSISRARWGQDKSKFTKFKNTLVESLKKSFNLSNFGEQHLIIDAPNPDKDKIGHINIISEDETGSQPINTVSPLWSSIAINFETWVRKVRFYIDQKYEADIRNKKDSLLTIIKENLGID